MITDIKINPRVAFVNIADGNIFFDCSPSEARRAINFLKNEKMVEMFKDQKIVVDSLREKILSKPRRACTIKESIISNNANMALSISGLNQYFCEIEKDDLIVDFMFLTAYNYAQIRNWGKTIYDEATNREMLESGVFGHIWTAHLVICNKIKDNFIYLVSVPDKNGNRMIKKFKILDNKLSK